LVTANIGADQITNALMADDAIGTAELADGAVDADRLASGAVTTVKIADDNVTHEKMETSAGLSVLGVTGNSTAHVADITAADGKVLRRAGTALEFGEIGTLGIADDAVTNAKVADDAVNSDQIADDSIDDAHINYGSVKLYGSQAASSGHRIHASTSAPSGGAEGDIWLRYTT
jgi:hypothetical protein